MSPSPLFSGRAASVSPLDAMGHVFNGRDATYRDGTLLPSTVPQRSLRSLKGVLTGGGRSCSSPGPIWPSDSPRAGKTNKAGGRVGGEGLSVRL